MLPRKDQDNKQQIILQFVSVLFAVVLPCAALKRLALFVFPPGPYAIGKSRPGCSIGVTFSHYKYSKNIL